MTYTIKFILSVDDDKVLSPVEIANLLYDKLDTPTMDVLDVELLEISD